MTRAAELPWQSLAEFALNAGIVVFFLGGLAWIVYALRSRYQDENDGAATRDEMLLQFRDLRRQGHLTEEEYRSIRGQLIERNADASPVGASACVRTDAATSVSNVIAGADSESSSLPTQEERA